MREARQTNVSCKIEFKNPERGMLDQTMAIYLVQHPVQPGAIGKVTSPCYVASHEIHCLCVWRFHFQPSCLTRSEEPCSIVPSVPVSPVGRPGPPGKSHEQDVTATVLLCGLCPAPGTVRYPAFLYGGSIPNPKKPSWSRLHLLHSGQPVPGKPHEQGIKVNSPSPLLPPGTGIQR